LLLLCHFLITGKGDEARDDGDVSELLSRFPVCTPPALFTVRALFEVGMGPNIAEAGIRAAVICLRLETREKIDAGPDGVEFGKRRGLGKG
jgi:hypothetical protein